MKICGVIAEYNPFHNGHAHQLHEARTLSGCDVLVVAMSGAFTQRGEIMLLDKWTRARMALLNGADVVVELPCLFAVRSADAFARGGVNLLAGLGADALSFGCETVDIDCLNRVLDAELHEDDELKAALRVRLQSGQVHARARAEALEETLGLPRGMLAQPNTVLALEYLRANRALDKPLEMDPVQRRQDYHSAELSHFASATAIRAALPEGMDAVKCAMPPSAYQLLADALPGRVADMARLDALLIDRIRSSTPSELAELPDVSEGLEHLLFHAAQMEGSREDLLMRMKCRRYTHARLSRLCAHALLGMTQAQLRAHPLPHYVRVLGFRRECAAALGEIHQRAQWPLMNQPSKWKDDPLFKLERRATDLQSLCFSDPRARAAGRDMTEAMIVL